MIFGDRPLREMARLYPQSLASFRNIQGVGQEKARTFGQLFVDVICAHTKKYGAKPDLTSQREPRIEYPRKAVITDTLSETKMCLEQKLSLRQIAEQRGLAETTVLTHLEKILSIESVDITHLKPSGLRFEAIEKAFRASGGVTLTPVRARLGNDYSFEELRLVRLFIQPTSG